jgi:hypothetical protein
VGSVALKSRRMILLYRERRRAEALRPVVRREPNAISNAVDYAKHRSRSHHRAVIRVYDAAGNVIETHEHAGEFKEW